MKKTLFIVFFLFVFIPFVFASSVLDYFPAFSPSQEKMLLSGEIVKGTSVSDDVMSFIPAGSLISDTAEEVLSYEKGFVIAVDMLIPYPEEMKDMNNEEMLLFLYNIR